MPRRSLRVTAAAHRDLSAGFARIREEMALPAAFPPAVEAEAEAVADAPPPERPDRTDLPLVTIDPPGSMDLDQALHIERRGHGFRVWYAIADVGAFVRPGGAIDVEAHERGETVYLPDGNVPLHPRRLSEGAASLLPGRVRPAALWRVDLDADGARLDAAVERALVASRARHDYAEVQRAVDDGTADGALALLAEVGPLREKAERARGGVSIPSAEQEIVGGDGEYRLEYRFPLPAETWNAQISLLTGIAAAEMMLDAGVGVLRTLPDPPPEDVAAVRRVATALDVPWPDGAGYGDVVAGLDPALGRHAAFLHESMMLLRGSGYTAFDGERPERAVHSAIAAPYAHVTAPLRRLVDRYGAEVCLAVCAGEPVPGWVRSALASLPEEMAASGRRAGAVERAAVDVMEAAVLAGRVGAEFTAVVVDADRSSGRVQLAEPAVIARCEGAGLPLGERIRVRLTEADPGRRRVAFAKV